MPTTLEARSIATTLWTQRERVLNDLQLSGVAAVETASLRALDSAYITSVLCRCESQKDAHPASAIVVEVPAASPQQVFFAQIHTISSAGRKPWYIVAVRRDSDGRWRFAHLTFGGYQAAPPLRALIRSASRTPAVAKHQRAQMARLAALGDAWVDKRTKRSDPWLGGGTVKRRVTLDVAKDGIYGLTLKSGRVLSCYTVHSLETFIPGPGRGLRQNPERTNWLHPLPAGLYGRITVDKAVAACSVGTGQGSHPGAIRWSYNEQSVGIAGVPV